MSSRSSTPSEILHDHAFDHVAQLAHIARPVVVYQRLSQRLGDAMARSCHAVGELLEEMFGQQRNVLLPLAQRRQRDVTTFSRWYRSWRNLPAAIAASRSRLVAEISRTLTLIGSLDADAR